MKNRNSLKCLYNNQKYLRQISQNVPQPSIIRSNFKVNAYNEIGVSIILLNTEVSTID